MGSEDRTKNIKNILYILVTNFSKYWIPGIYILNVLVLAKINIKINEGNSMSLQPTENIKFF